MSYGSTTSSPAIVRVPSEFAVQPPLADVLHAIDLFGTALVAPPTPVAPQAVVVPPGYYKGADPPPAPTAVDRRKQLTELVLAYHHQLIALEQSKQSLFAQVQVEQKRLKDAQAMLAKSEGQQADLEARLSTALHTIEALQAHAADAKRAAGEASVAARARRSQGAS